MSHVSKLIKICFSGLAVILWFFAVTPVSATEVDWQKIPAIADKIIASDPNNIEELASKVEEAALGEHDRAALIYCILAKSINYDVELMNALTNERMEAETVWQRRKGVCSNYVDLYRAIADKTHLTTFSIVGYSKFRDLQELSSSPDHEWLMLIADNRELLIDPTWGAGHLNEENLFVKQFETKWFDMKPELFAQTHYPVAPMFQLVDCPVSFDAFKMDVEQTITHFERKRKCPSWRDTLKSFLSQPEDLKPITVGRQAYTHTGDRQLYAIALLDYVSSTENKALRTKKNALSNKQAAEAYRQVLLDQQAKVSQAIALLKPLQSAQARASYAVAQNNLKAIEGNINAINQYLKQRVR